MTPEKVAVSYITAATDPPFLKVDMIPPKGECHIEARPGIRSQFVNNHWL